MKNLKLLSAAGFAFALILGCGGKRLAPDSNSQADSNGQALLYFAVDTSHSSMVERSLYPKLLLKTMSIAASRGYHFELDTFTNDRNPQFIDSKLPYARTPEGARLLRYLQNVPESKERGTYFAPIFRHAIDLAKAQPKRTIYLIFLTDAGVDDPDQTIKAVKEASQYANIVRIGFYPVTNRVSTFKTTSTMLAPFGNRLYMGTTNDSFERIEQMLNVPGGE